MSSLEKHRNALYKQVRQELFDYITNYRLAPHTLLPSENAIAQKYNVSKMTAKLALNALEDENIIYRIPRRGSFVAPATPQEQIDNEVDFEITGTLKPFGFIALILPILDAYTAEIMTRIADEVEALGYHLMVKITKHNIAQEERFLDELACISDVKGILLFPVGREQCGNVLLQLQLSRYPIVLIDTIFRDLSLDSVSHDHYQGSYDITNYLVKKGHKHIGFITYSVALSQSRFERHRAYVNALVDAGLFINKNNMLSISDDDSIDIFDTYLHNNPELTAVFCVNDELASRFMLRAIYLGLRIPEDISIVGFTDSSILQTLPVPLTTVRQPVKRFATEAVAILVNRIKNPYIPKKAEVIPTEIVERSSVKDFNITFST